MSLKTGHRTSLGSWEFLGVGRLPLVAVTDRPFGAEAEASCLNLVGDFSMLSSTSSSTGTWPATNGFE